MLGLHCQYTHITVEVVPVVGDDGERQNDEAELSKLAKRVLDQHGIEQAANGTVCISIQIDRGLCGLCGSDHGCSEKLGEEEWEDEPGVGPGENLLAAGANRLVNGVVGSIARPSGSETEDCSSQRKN